MAQSSNQTKLFSEWGDAEHSWKWSVNIENILRVVMSHVIKATTTVKIPEHFKWVTML